MELNCILNDDFQPFQKYWTPGHIYSAMLPDGCWGRRGCLVEEEIGPHLRKFRCLFVQDMPHGIGHTILNITILTALFQQGFSGSHIMTDEI